MEDADRIFNSRLCGYALDSLYDNLLSLLVGIELGLVYDFIDVAGSIRTSLVFQAFYQSVFSLFGAQSGEFFQHFTLLQLHFFEFSLLNLQQFLFIVDALLLMIHLLLSASEFFLTLTQSYFSLLELVLGLLDFLVAQLNFLLQLRFLVQEFLLDLQQFLFLNHISLFISGCYHFIIFSFNNVTENRIATQSAKNQRYDGNNYYTHYF